MRVSCSREPSMRMLIQKLQRMEGGTILVVGAGSCAELPLLRQVGADRLVLVEANPGLADLLSRKIDSGRGEVVWAKALSSDPKGSCQLHVLNHPGFSSLNRPGKLLEHFPNIRVVDHVDVPACSLEEAVVSLQLARDGKNVLVIDAPGLAYELLEAASLETLQAFGAVIARAGVEPLYDNDRSLDDVLRLLRERGFEQQHDDPEAVYPMAASLLVAEPLRIENQRLEALVAQLRSKCDDQATLAARQADGLEQARRGRDHAVATVNRLKAELEAALADARTQRDLVSSRDAQIAALASERAELSKALANKEASLAKAVEELRALRRTCDEQGRLASERDELSKALEDKEASLAEASEELQALRKARDEQARLASERQALLEKATALSRERGARIIALEREQARLEHHQAWLDEEVVKAETQVELIKDILLREKAL